MEFNDARPRDWRMYFNGTWMLHEELGVVYLNVEGENVYMSQDGEAELCKDVSKLHIWWPRAGAYNTPDGVAVWIDRKAERSMKKSCAGTHHYDLVRLGSGRNVMAKSNQMVRYMIHGPNYVSWQTAQEVLGTAAKSVAITRDIIAEYIGPDEYKLYLRAIPVGVLKNGVFTPEDDMDPLTKRAAYKLMKEGII